MARHTLGNSGYITVKNYSNAQHAGVAYAQDTSQLNGVQWTAELGGTNNRVIKCGVHGGSSGTTTYYLTIAGYWTEE
jgi:hypothetical protein